MADELNKKEKAKERRDLKLYSRQDKIVIFFFFTRRTTNSFNEVVVEVKPLL